VDLEDCYKLGANSYARCYSGRERCSEDSPYDIKPYQIDLTHGGSLPTRSYQGSVSIGITLFRGNSISVDELMKRADTAMYQAKAAGRNTLRFFDPGMQAAVTACATLDTPAATATAAQPTLR